MSRVTSGICALGPVALNCGRGGKWIRKTGRSFILNLCGPEGADVFGPERLCSQVATANGGWSGAYPPVLSR